METPAQPPQAETKRKKPYAPPQVRTERILVPDLFTPSCIIDPDTQECI